MKSWVIAASSLLLATAIVQAKPERTLELREDQRPSSQSWEIGVRGVLEEVKARYGWGETDDRYEGSVYLRYGVTPNLSLHTAIPYVSWDRSGGSSESGLGDVEVGMQLVTWRDAFDYPYVMPFATLFFPTGDEEKQLGEGEVTARLGVAGGSKVWDTTDFIVNVRYELNATKENRAAAGLAIVHELSRQFAVSSEGLIWSEEDPVSRRRPKLWLVGMTYQPNPRWVLGFHGGREVDGARDTLVGMKIGYLFGK